MTSSMTRLLSRTLMATAAACVGCVPLSASAQFKKPEDAIHYRQSVLNVMGTHFARLAAVAKGDLPFDAAAVQADAAIVLMMSKLPFSAFGPGTESGGNTKAKPDIWSKRAVFDEAAQKMQAEVVKLDEAARTGDIAKLRPAVGDTGKSCKACHDDFRAR